MSFGDTLRGAWGVLRGRNQVVPAGSLTGQPDDQAELRVAGSVYEVQLNTLSDTYSGWDPWCGEYGGYVTIPGAWRASILLSDLFAQMPFHSYRASGDGGEVRTPRNAVILEAPAGSWEDPAVTMAAWGMDYLWEGNACGLFTARNPTNGLPTAVLPVRASQVGVRWTATGRREYQVGNQVFDQSDVFHVKGPCAPGALRGMGVLETQTRGLRLAKDLQLQASDISTHGVPTGILKAMNSEVTPTSLEAAKTRWLETQTRRTIAALGPFIDFTPLAWNPEEMEMVEARKFSLTEQELMFGLPVGWLGGATSSRTYSNVESDATNLVKFSTLAGMVLRFESVFSTRTLPRGQTAKANRDAVLRGDTLSRYQAHTIALGGKAWRTRNEVRSVENEEPIPGWDEQDEGITPEPATEPTTDPTAAPDAPADPTPVDQVEPTQEG